MTESDSDRINSLFLDEMLLTKFTYKQSKILQSLQQQRISLQQKNYNNNNNNNNNNNSNSNNNNNNINNNNNNNTHTSNFNTNNNNNKCYEITLTHNFASDVLITTLQLSLKDSILFSELLQVHQLQSNSISSRGVFYPVLNIKSQYSQNNSLVIDGCSYCQSIKLILNLRKDYYHYIEQHNLSIKKQKSKNIQQENINKILTYLINNIKIYGYSNQIAPPATQLNKLLNISQLFKKNNLYQQQAQTDILLGLCMINARRFIQASEILRKASNYFVKKYISINAKNYTNNNMNTSNIHNREYDDMNMNNMSRNNIVQQNMYSSSSRFIGQQQNLYSSRFIHNQQSYLHNMNSIINNNNNISKSSIPAQHIHISRNYSTGRVLQGSKYLLKAAKIQLLLGQNITHPSLIHQKLQSYTRSYSYFNGNPYPVQLSLNTDIQEILYEIGPNLIVFLMKVLYDKIQLLRISALKTIQYIYETIGCSLSSIMPQVLKTLVVTYPANQGNNISNNIIGNNTIGNNNIVNSNINNNNNAPKQSKNKTLIDSYHHLLQTFIGLLPLMNRKYLRIVFKQIILPNISILSIKNQLKLYLLRFSQKILLLCGCDLDISIQFISSIISLSQKKTLSNIQSSTQYTIHNISYFSLKIIELLKNKIFPRIDNQNLIDLTVYLKENLVYFCQNQIVVQNQVFFNLLLDFIAIIYQRKINNNVKILCPIEPVIYFLNMSISQQILPFEKLLQITIILLKFINNNNNNVNNRHIMLNNNINNNTSNIHINSNTSNIHINSNTSNIHINKNTSNIHINKNNKSVNSHNHNQISSQIISRILLKSKHSTLNIKQLKILQQVLKTTQQCQLCWLDDFLNCIPHSTYDQIYNVFNILFKKTYTKINHSLLEKILHTFLDQYTVKGKAHQSAKKQMIQLLLLNITIKQSNQSKFNTFYSNKIHDQKIILNNLQQQHNTNQSNKQPHQYYNQNKQKQSILIDSLIKICFTNNIQPKIQNYISKKRKLIFSKKMNQFNQFSSFNKNTNNNSFKYCSNNNNKSNNQHFIDSKMYKIHYQMFIQKIQLFILFLNKLQQKSRQFYHCIDKIFIKQIYHSLKKLLESKSTKIKSKTLKIIYYFVQIFADNILTNNKQQINNKQEANNIIQKPIQTKYILSQTDLIFTKCMIFLLKSFIINKIQSKLHYQTILNIQLIFMKILILKQIKNNMNMNMNKQSKEQQQQLINDEESRIDQLKQQQQEKKNNKNIDKNKGNIYNLKNNNKQLLFYYQQYQQHNNIQYIFNQYQHQNQDQLNKIDPSRTISYCQSQYFTKQFFSIFPSLFLLLSSPWQNIRQNIVQTILIFVSDSIILIQQQKLCNKLIDMISPLILMYLKSDDHIERLNGCKIVACIIGMAKQYQNKQQMQDIVNRTNKYIKQFINQIYTLKQDWYQPISKISNIIISLTLTHTEQSLLYKKILAWKKTEQIMQNTYYHYNNNNNTSFNNINNINMFNNINDDSNYYDKNIITNVNIHQYNQYNNNINQSFSIIHNDNNVNLQSLLLKETQNCQQYVDKQKIIIDQQMFIEITYFRNQIFKNKNIKTSFFGDNQSFLQKQQENYFQPNQQKTQTKSEKQLKAQQQLLEFQDLGIIDLDDQQWGQQQNQMKITQKLPLKKVYKLSPNIGTSTKHQRIRSKRYFSHQFQTNDKIIVDELQGRINHQNKIKTNNNNQNINKQQSIIKQQQILYTKQKQYLKKDIQKQKQLKQLEKYKEKQIQINILKKNKDKQKKYYQDKKNYQNDKQRKNYQYDKQRRYHQNDRQKIYNQYEKQFKQQKQHQYEQFLQQQQKNQYDYDQQQKKQVRVKTKQYPMYQKMQKIQSNYHLLQKQKQKSTNLTKRVKKSAKKRKSSVIK